MATAHPQRRRRRTQLVATVLCLGVGAYGMVLVGSGFSLIPDPVCGNTFPLALRMHVAASSLALLLLPLQGVPGLRRRGSPWHRWVGRGSAALAFAAVTLRIELPLASALGIGWDVAYPAIAWLCWIPNPLVAQRLIARSPNRSATSVSGQRLPSSAVTSARL